MKKTHNCTAFFTNDFHLTMILKYNMKNSNGYMMLPIVEKKPRYSRMFRNISEMDLPMIILSATLMKNKSNLKNYN